MYTILISIKIECTPAYAALGYRPNEALSNIHLHEHYRHMYVITQIYIYTNSEVMNQSNLAVHIK